MTGASTAESMSPSLLEVAERAIREPDGKFHSLAHHIDIPMLMRAYDWIRKDAAVGVDGITKGSTVRTWSETSGTCTLG